MVLSFKDYFSENSAAYSQFRPRYPVELFAYLFSLSKHHELVWDCATGTGQSAVDLADHFSQVIATDASKDQIQNAVPKKCVEYRIGTAEKSPFAADSVGLITVAQALHWFDLNAFSKEVNRVLVDGGFLAVWTYNLLNISEDLDAVIHYFYYTVLDEFWPPERKLVEAGYADIQLPFTEINTPSFHMTEEWDMHQLVGYISTWSAVKQYEKKQGHNPLEKILAEIQTAWRIPETKKEIQWPLSLRVWKKTQNI